MISGNVAETPPNLGHGWVNISLRKRQALIWIKNWLIVDWIHRNKLKWNSKYNTIYFIHKNVFENFVCEMLTILSKGRWIKIFRPHENLPFTFAKQQIDAYSIFLKYISPWTKRPPFRSQHSQMHFNEWEMYSLTRIFGKREILVLCQWKLYGFTQQKINRTSYRPII